MEELPLQSWVISLAKVRNSPSLDKIVPHLIQKYGALSWEVNSKQTEFSLLWAHRRKGSQGLNWECIPLCSWRVTHIIPLLFILIFFLSLGWISTISDHSHFIFFFHTGYREKQLCNLQIKQMDLGNEEGVLKWWLLSVAIELYPI